MFQIFLTAALLLCGAYINANDTEIDALARALKAIAMAPEPLTYEQQKIMNFQLIESIKQNKSIETIQEIIKKGANVNCRSTHGMTPLHLAYWRSNLDVAKLLIEKGADVNAEDEIQESTPLFWARNFKFATPLIQNGAKLDVQDKYKNTLLHHACSTGDTEFIKFLIGKGANVNAENNVKKTPLHSACTSGDLKAVELILKEKPNVNAKSTLGITPLHEACAQDNFDIATLLITHGADVNAKDINGRMPLHEACGRSTVEAIVNRMVVIKKRTTDIAKFLVEQGSNLFTSANNGKTPWENLSKEEKATLLQSLFPLKPNVLLYPRSFLENMLFEFSQAMTNSVDSIKLDPIKEKTILNFDKGAWTKKELQLTEDERNTVLSIVKKLITLLYIGKKKFLEDIAILGKNELGFTDKELIMCAKLFTDKSPLINFLALHSQSSMKSKNYYLKNLKTIEPEPVEKKGKKKKPFYEDIKIFFKKFYEA